MADIYLCRYGRKDPVSVMHPAFVFDIGVHWLTTEIHSTRVLYSTNGTNPGSKKKCSGVLPLQHYTVEYPVAKNTPCKRGVTLSRYFLPVKDNDLGGVINSLLTSEDMTLN